MGTSDVCGSAAGFESLGFFAGLDWAVEEHHVAVVDRNGQVVRQFRLADDAVGWEQLGRELVALGGPVGVAIETSHGPAVERLLALGLAVYPMNPKAATRFRERKAPSGVKDDALDAYCFADALRTDGRDWRPLRPQDAATQLLRLLCRDEIALIEQRTALVHQLKEALREYYPAALEAFDDWTRPCTWEFVLRFPTPRDLVQAGKRKQQNFLHQHRLYRPELAEKRLAIFARAEAFASPSTAVTTAKSLLAMTVAKQLRVLETQIQEYRRRIETAFAEHPDGAIFASLPGGGKKLAPRLLGEIGADRDVFASAEALQCYAGTAPLTWQSGQRRFAKIRWMCNKVLRASVHLFADESRQTCAWAQAYYQQKKSEGQSHAQALRCLGQRWLKILWKMWQDRQPYDEARHTLDQVRHGSWVVALCPASRPAVVPQT